VADRSEAFFSNSSMTRQRKVQLLLWTYFWLLIFEGALRKWIFPGLSNPLLIVRDPVALMAICLGWPYLVLSSARAWVISIWSIGVLAFFAAILVGHGDWATALFGGRILFLHLPLIFLFGAVFSIGDVWRFARYTLVLTIPMAFLMAAQFNLPEDHFINIAPGGEGSAAFSGAMGKMRPPGVFSFISGLASFFGLAAAFFVGWLACGPVRKPKWFWFSVAAIVFALPLSISRTLLFYYALVMIFAAASIFLSGRKIKPLLAGLAAVAIIAAALSTIEIFQIAQEAFGQRWMDAKISDAGDAGDRGLAGILLARVGGSFLESIESMQTSELLGAGIGLGTNFGAMRAIGEKGFVLAEGSWPATIGELGPFLGFALIFWRSALAIQLAKLSYSKALQKNPLPMILGGISLQALVLGQTSQPTALGFIVVCSGLMLAACNGTNPCESSMFRVGDVSERNEYSPT
jgi:hypothetical protein